MIEIDIADREKAEELYERIRSIILSNKNNKNCKYNLKQHHLYEESEYPGISKHFYNETGSYEFRNNKGKGIIVEISRWHNHQHNGWSGLNGNPCLYAQIYILNMDKKELLWELKIEARTLYWKAQATSLDIPEEYLIPRPKITKKRPKKATNKVYPEWAIIDDRSIDNALTEVYKCYYSASQKKDEITKEKESKIKQAIEEITAQYKKEINNSTLEVKNTKTKLDKYDSLVTKYSTFNVDLIGNAIAKLITTISGKKFLYKTVVDKYQKRVHGPIDSWDEITKREAKIIVDSNKAQNVYDNSYADGYEKYASEIDQLVEDGYAILLSSGNCIPKSIPFLTSKNGEISFNINFDNYEYIKDFIMELVQYRFQRKIDKISETEIDLCVKRFIKKSEETIIQNHVLILKKELDTLTSKLNS